jgi:hypothetical protein
MSWKNWSDHPFVAISTSLASLAAIVSLGYFINDRYSGHYQQMINVNLLSERGIDYSHLRQLLIENKWEEGNRETLSLMLKATDREQQGFMDTTIMRQFPCKDLLTIEELWSKASRGKFGFLVQQGIWQRIGGEKYKIGENLYLFRRFEKEVG